MVFGRTDLACRRREEQSRDDDKGGNRRNSERDMTWEKFNLLKRYPLPHPKIVHSIFKKKTT